MNNPILKIELVDSNRMDVVVKGTKHDVIKMLVTAMREYPEAAEAITEAAIEFHGVPKPGKITIYPA